MRLWDVATGEAVAALGRHSSIVYAVAFSPDGHIVAAAGRLVDEQGVWRRSMELREVDLPQGVRLVPATASRR